MTTRHNIRVRLEDNSYEEHNIMDIISNLKALSFDLDTRHIDYALVEQKLLQGFSQSMSK